jgi:hypothetical protein
MKKIYIYVIGGILLVGLIAFIFVNNNKANDKLIQIKNI